jgi:hypothetical protein
MWLSGPRSRPAASQKIWKSRESNPLPLDLQPETLTTRPQRFTVIVIVKVKGKVVPLLKYVIKHYAMKKCGGVEV